MTISYNWLKDYLNVDLPAERVGEILTDIGLEVEGIEKVESIKGGLEGVVVGEVLTCVQHPNADRLKVTTVNVGADEPLQIVCGAPNVAVGQKVPVATINTVLYADDKPFTIKKGKIRGEVSMGMICAEDELGLGASHDGIMVLENSTNVGTLAKDYFNIETDYVFEIGLTPNRTDAMSHYGVARDLRAGLIQQGIETKLTVPTVNFKVDNTDLTIPVSVENKNACPQYLGVTLTGLKVEASPTWLQNRLNAIGLKPINNIVDITNFVLHETGHPLHAFDADQIEGKKVIVKTLPDGSKFTTLDEVERTLGEDDLMICDAEKGMCIAGVFGGTTSGVTEKTTSVFLEGAWFNAVSVRKTAKRHGLNTDASYRYERGVDPNMTEYALMRAAVLMKEIAGGTISSEIQKEISTELKPVEIELKHDYLNALVGNDIPSEKVEEILHSLEFEIAPKKQGVWHLKVPTYRVDVTRPADVVEEFLRIYGFNNVTLPERMQISLAAANPDRSEEFKSKAGAMLTAIGFSEIMNNSLTKRNYYERFSKEKEGQLVEILNPLSQDLGVMRQTLLFGGLEVVAHNINRQVSDLRIFEFGNTYFKNAKADYSEKEQLMVLLSGKDGAESWQHKPKSTSIFQLKANVYQLFERFGLDQNLIEETSTSKWLGETLLIKSGEKTLCELGRVSVELLGYFDISQEVFVAIFDWPQTVRKASKQKIKFQELSKHPHVRRDLALLVNESTTYQELKVAAGKAGGKLLKSINLFDVYTGKNLPAGKKSYAMSFILQDPTQTLVDKRVDGVMKKIFASLHQQFGAELR